MRKLVFTLLAFFAVFTFLSTFDKAEAVEHPAIPVELSGELSPATEPVEIVR